jgi:ribosome-associated protein
MTTKKSQTKKPRSAPLKKKPKAGAAPRTKKPAAKKPRPPKAPRVPKAPKPSRSPLELKDNPQAHALARKIAAAVLDKKALDVVILDVRGRSSYADYLVLASGESERQVAAMADGVEDKLREEGLRPLGSEGHETGQWVLVDYGEVVGHFFHTEMRAFYDLEGLWADAGRESVR